MKGWLFDLYPGEPGEMVVWMKDGNGGMRRLVDPWSPSLFVASDDRELLGSVADSLEVRRYASRVDFVQRRERITDSEESEVLRVTVRDATRLVELARRIESLHAFGDVRLYNCDVPPAQSYLYDHDIFPLAFCEVVERPYGLRWKLEDDTEEYDYATPPMRKSWLGVKTSRSGLIAKMSDPIEDVWLEENEVRQRIPGATEKEKICGLVERVSEADLDILFTRDGDSFLFPYLMERAERNGVAEELVLGRDPVPLKRADRAGFSYFSYGKIFFKPSSVRLYGRLHLDVSSSFSHAHSGTWGLYEVSRVCMQPLHTSSRSSIGKALSSLQFYHATKKGILIPWKPVLAERFKLRSELMVADRGGFICDPLAGVYDEVAELDFASLYPNIMLKKNISAETVKCPCCPDSKERVPELGWNVCEKRQGITSKTMEVIVKKRLEYKKLKQLTKDEAQRIRYDERQALLKWLGVTCLPRESPVFVKQGDTERFVRIGDFIDSIAGEKTGVLACPPDILVAGIGDGYAAKYARIANLIKKPNDQRLLSVEMEDGRKIVATRDHPFFVLREGELSVTSAQDLAVGEVIPTARKIPSVARTDGQIDLIERLGGLLDAEEQSLWRVSGPILRDECLRKKRELIKAAMSNGYTYQTAIFWIRTGIIPYKFFGLLGITKESHQGLRIGVGRRLGGRIAWLPAVIKVDANLGFFLGLYVADGSATKTYVRFAIASSEPELLQTTKKLVELLFGIAPIVYKETKARMYVVQVNSASLVRALQKVFDLPGSAEKGKLKVPDVVFNGGACVSHGFIAGLVAGDGHASKIRKFVNVATASKDLQEQVSFLAARLGLAYRLATDRKGSNKLYTVNFVGPETLGNIADWEYSKENQRENIRSWSEESPLTCNHPRYLRLPAAESDLFTLVKTTRTSSNPHVGARYRTCPVQVKKKLDRISSKKLSDACNEQISRVKKLVSGDLGFVRILKIAELDTRPDYVYCFQLADEEVPGFFTGEGLIFTHNCFGYLGYNNAKFGRIDAHIAVCAWDREVMLRSLRTAEREGFHVIHGIVDSLWVKKKGAAERDYEQLGDKIQAETGFDLSFEGIYKWIAFLNSKADPRLAVQNRYFGSYRRKGLKMRGIESRRHDTPQAFRECQGEILDVMKDADSVDGVKAVIPACAEVFGRYVGMMRRAEIPAEMLVFTRNISKDPREYRNDTLEAEVVRTLLAEGAALHQGESISYVITDFYSGERRVIPADAIDGQTRYDARRYAELLAEVCSTVMQPFDARMTPRGLLALARPDGVRALA